MAIANTEIKAKIEAGEENMADTTVEITSVCQLSDVQPTDWYFNDLQSLIEDFGIIMRCPGGTFNADEPLSRADAVSILNQGLKRLLEVIAAATEPK
jgi:hypothetical protein